MYNFYTGQAAVSNFTVPDPATICFWLILRGFNVSLNNLIGTATNWRAKFNVSTTKIEANFNQTASLASVSTVGIGTRIHLAFVNLRSTRGKLYFNGIEEGDNSGSSTPTSPNTLAVGGTNGVSDNANGDMEDIRVYNRELSAQEIKNIYGANGLDLIYDGLINRWALTSKGDGTDIGTDPIYDLTTARKHLTKVSNNVYFRGGFINPRRRV